MLCSIGKVTPSAYYKWIKRKNKDNDLENCMKYIFYIKYNKNCGYRTLHSELHDLGIRISYKKTREKMREFGLVCDIRRKKKNKNYVDIKENNKTFPNVLNREFVANKPNEKYCTDTTEIETQEDGIVNCSVILDLFNLQPFGLEVQKSCNSNLTISSIELLNKERNLNGVLLHSDQGITYTNKRFCNLLKDLNITQSMSRKGCPYDNSPIENFWGTLKTEKIYKLKYKPKNIAELREIIEEYIYHYINARKCSRLGYLTPKQYYDKYILSI